MALVSPVVVVAWLSGVVVAGWLPWPKTLER
jgi:hypothetical protein